MTHFAVLMDITGHDVFPSVSRKYWFFITGYGIPGLITAAAAYYDPTGFGTLDHCWYFNI
uniref:G_PROTEIN_RECEP_F2_4 domain-containing protein n=1 Tax=Heterorhabditis bacteriophora TaxID=37862 RepID=A0A1I7WPD3_HETBA